jgi:YbgC/YbaW family acyl-CoA thioester hydrolase
MKLNTQTYSTRLSVRPDDIDMFRHVHSSRYIDYVLAARFDQMINAYKCGMQEFLDAGLGWVMVSTELNYKRPLKLGDEMIVETHIASMEKQIAHVEFDIKNAANMKSSCSGWVKYALVSIDSGRPVPLPEWVIQRFSVED